MSKTTQMMIKANTDDALIDTFNSALADWLDHGQVSHSECPDAPHSQWKIGWNHVFTGHLSQEWEKLQGDNQTGETIHRATDWASNPVTLILQTETRNLSFHRSRCGAEIVHPTSRRQGRRSTKDD